MRASSKPQRIVGILLCTAMAAGAVAQEYRLQVRGGTSVFQSNESYAGGARVAGETLVGLAHESLDPDLELERVAIDYRGKVASESVCVRFTTGDGRYWALVPYEGGERYEAPPLLDIPTRFDDVLEQYAPTDFLTLATLGDCDSWESDDAVLVPARLGGHVADNVLVAQININRGTVTAVLTSESTKRTGKCSRVDGGARVSYSRICRFELDDSMTGRLASLSISVNSLVGIPSPPKEFTVALW